MKLLLHLPNLFETIFSTFQFIDLNQVSETIKKFRLAKGWNRSEIARQLGISSQLYGQYEDDKRSPGGDFFINWKLKFGQDLTEAIVSHETKENDSIMDQESRRSLEKTLENLSEDKIRSTAIVERLVTMIEKQFKTMGPELPPPGTPGTETLKRKKSAQ